MLGFYYVERMMQAAQKALSPREFIYEAVMEAPEHRVRQWLIEELEMRLRREQRSAVLVIEKEATRRMSQEDLDRYYSERRDRDDENEAQIKKKSKFDLKNDPEYQRAMQAIETKHLQKIDGLVQEIKRQVREEIVVEWSHLLPEEIAMPDGSRTTWGKATLTQLKMREEMVDKNAVALVVTSARLSKAIEFIKSVPGATCLNEALESGL